MSLPSNSLIQGLFAFGNGFFELVAHEVQQMADPHGLDVEGQQIVVDQGDIDHIVDNVAQAQDAGIDAAQIIFHLACSEFCTISAIMEV
jgi:hypothetical protein